jgi:hypothetical protein
MVHVQRSKEPPSAGARAVAATAVADSAAATGAGDSGSAAVVGTELCLDCGTVLQGAFCHACGQRRESRLVPIPRLVGSAIEDTIGPDARVARTLRLLFTRPGALTLAFWEGQRTRYMPPVRLYLMASLVYFVVLEATGATRFFFLKASGAELEFGQFIERLPQLMFLMLPAFAALVAAFYRRTGRLYAEHLVFALHYHAFAFLVLPIDAAVDGVIMRTAPPGETSILFVTGAILAGVAQLSVLAYLFITLRRVYGGSRMGTLMRTLLLFILYMTFLAGVGVLATPWLRTLLWTTLRS